MNLDNNDFLNTFWTLTADMEANPWEEEELEEGEKTEKATRI